MQTEQRNSTVRDSNDTGLFEPDAKSVQTLLHDCCGETLMITETDGISDIFCRNECSGLNRQSHALHCLANVTNGHKARFFVGNLTPAGGRFRSIDRDMAIQIVTRWIFENQNQQ
ncbi:MAG: hypothetical protein KJ804_04610 [Proteobacteria bacterium]|nr:hypothetical protein [Pseudomonadota bacterium]MBU1057585.1 hypothetical protein [Pseudomonadota bacterium]